MNRAPRTFSAALAAFLVQASAASAQLAHRPFSVGGVEGGGGAEGGVTGYLIAEQSRLTHLMAQQVHALHGNPSALWGLVALGLGYGVFHAAGPGHGKALIASYMMANERSLRRGAVMALLAALLQATAAIVLVGAAALILHATASQMSAAADWLTLASAAGVVAIGLWLSWRKGRALIAALRLRFERGRALAATPAFAGIGWTPPARTLSAAAYSAADPDAEPDQDFCCAPDAAAIAGPLSFRDAAGTVIAAGARPCSGAILDSGLCPRAGRIRGRDRGHFRDGARRRGDDRGARLDGGVRQVYRGALRLERGYARRACGADVRIRRIARGARLRPLAAGWRARRRVSVRPRVGAGTSAPASHTPWRLWSAEGIDGFHHLKTPTSVAFASAWARTVASKSAVDLPASGLSRAMSSA